MTGARQKLREAAIVVAVIFAALIALRQSARHPGELSTLDRGILTVIAPVQSILATIARSISNVAGHYVELVHVRGENDSLRSQNALLRTELLEAKRAAQESVRLQRLLGLRDSVPAATLTSRVISIDASPYFRVARIEIDRGEGLVRRGMPIITADGVVGRINRVAGGTSDIQLAVDPRSAIDVILPRSGGRGILTGKPGENGYRCQIQYLVRGGEQAREGDTVVTSGLGDFPRDLTVGTVSKVTKSAAGLFQEVEVIPTVDFARLSEVLVVVAPAAAPDTDAAARRSNPAPARGISVYR